MTTSPQPEAESITAWQRRVAAELPHLREVIQRDVNYLSDYPEAGGEEVETAAYLSSRLEEIGFEVERGVAGLPTAFTATYGAIAPGGRIGIAVVYDGVPAVDQKGRSAPDHSCGHLPISAGAIAVAELWKRMADSAQGSLTILGCPADEHATDISRARGGGKAALAEAGLLDELDAVIYVHPEDGNYVLRATQCSVRFRGTLTARRHPGELPRLLARMAEFGAEAEFSEDRQSAYIERVVTTGDAAVNAIVVVSCDLMVRAHSEAELQEAIDRVMAEGGDIAWEQTSRYDGLQPNDGLIEHIEAVFRGLGMEYNPNPPLIPYATDFGRMTRTIPGALIGYGDCPWAFHTPECSTEFLEKAVPQAEQYARVTSVVVPVLAEATQKWD